MNSRLSGAADSSLVEKYFQRDETAIAETRSKYGKLALNIASKLLDEQESEECLNDALLRVWNSVPPEKPDNFKAYFCKITRNLALNKLRFNTRQKRNFEAVVSLTELEEVVAYKTDLDDGELGAVLNKFLAKLKPCVRNVFVRRYYFFDSIYEISALYGYSEDKINSMLYRTRKKTP